MSSALPCSLVLLQWRINTGSFQGWKTQSDLKQFEYFWKHGPWTMCLDPVVVSLSANLLFGPLACRPGQKKPRWWAAGGDCAGGQKLPGTATLAQAVPGLGLCFQMAAPACSSPAHGLHCFHCCWVEGRRKVLCIFCWEGFKDLLQRVRSTDMACWERGD